MELRKDIVNYMIEHGLLLYHWKLICIDRASWIGSSQHLQAYILPRPFTDWENIVYDCVFLYLIVH